MTRLEVLLGQLARMKGTLQELQEVGNHRDQAARFRELKGYLQLFMDDLERLENEHFRTDPAQAVKRAIIRTKSMTTDNPNVM